MIFPLVAFDLIENGAADELLKLWGHWLGGCNRPFGTKTRPAGLLDSALEAEKGWPTPRAEDSEQVGNHTGPNSHAGEALGAAAKSWATPQEHDGRRPGPETASTLEGNLKKQVELFATPTTRDTKDSPGQTVAENGLLGRQVMNFPPGPPTETTGKPGPGSLSDGRKLNPLFDEWLINWPIGWTCPHKDRASGITDFARWETGSIQSLRRWLSAYWQSGLESAPCSGSARTET